MLTLPIWNFCQEKIVELEVALDEAKKMVAYYQEVDETEMWLRDLDEFEEAWKTYQSGREVQNYQRKQNQAKKKQSARERAQMMAMEPPAAKKKAAGRNSKK